MPTPRAGTDSPMTDAVLQTNAQLVTIRKRLIAIAAETDLLAPALCRCENPACANRTAAGLETERILVTFNDTWLTTTPEAVLDTIPPTRRVSLDLLLRALTDTCELWDLMGCDCPSPSCPWRHPKSLSTPLLLHRVALSYRRQGGCQHLAPLPPATMAARQARRRARLTALVAPIEALDIPAIGRMLRRQLRLRDTQAHRECDRRTAHTLGDVYGEGVWEWFASHPLPHAALTLGERHGFAMDEVEALGHLLQQLTFSVAADGFMARAATLPFLAPFLDEPTLAPLLAWQP